MNPIAIEIRLLNKILFGMKKASIKFHNPLHKNTIPIKNNINPKIYNLLFFF